MEPINKKHNTALKGFKHSQQSATSLLYFHYSTHDTIQMSLCHGEYILGTTIISVDFYRMVADLR